MSYLLLQFGNRLSRCPGGPCANNPHSEKKIKSKPRREVVGSTLYFTPNGQGFPGKPHRNSRRKDEGLPVGTHPELRNQRQGLCRPRLTLIIYFIISAEWFSSGKHGATETACFPEYEVA